MGRTPRANALAVVDRLRGHGHETYFAGGCVRDELLGIPPKDYDVATDARPDRVAELFSATREVGKAFAVMQVRSGRSWIEVATFRADAGYSDSRRPDAIRFAEAEEDAKRRDFTINALFRDPLDVAEDELGRVIDFVGGVDDLRAKLVRAVGEPRERLAEDHLRALRAVRFAARLGFAIERGTKSAIRDEAAALRGVSRERVGDEVMRMLGHPSRAHAAALLEELTLDEPSLDEPGEPSDRAAMAALSGGASAAAGLAAWAVDRCGGDAARAVERIRAWRGPLCLSNDDQAEAAATAGLAADLVGWDALPTAVRKRLAARPVWDDALAIHRARHPAGASAISRDTGALEADGIGIAPPPLLDGEALIKAGHQPGPKFGIWLEQVYDAQLEGRVRTRTEALEWVAQRAADETDSGHAERA